MTERTPTGHYPELKVKNITAEQGGYVGRFYTDKNENYHQVLLFSTPVMPTWKEADAALNAEWERAREQFMTAWEANRPQEEKL